MVFSTNADKYALEASIYEQLACYYKYSNPQKHMEYYVKHYEAVQKLIQTYHRAVQPQGQPHPAKVRLLHTSPNTPTVDIYINGNRMLQDISFKQCSNYLLLPQGQYRIDLYVSQTDTDTAPVLSAILPIMNHYTYTVAASGNEGKLQLLPFVDSTYLPYNEAHIRLAHLSPDAPAIDIALKDGDILLSDISFKQISNYLQVSPGVGNLEIRIAGTQDVVLSLPDTKIEANKIYTIYVVGYANKTPALEALFLTN